MLCPVCGMEDSRVVRTLKGSRTNRERQCECGAGWATIETIIRGSVRIIQGVPRVPIHAEVITSVISRDGGRCRYCGSSDEALGVDHIIPLCAAVPAGTTIQAELIARNAPANLVASCRRCNSAKGDRVNGKRVGARYSTEPMSANDSPTAPNSSGGSISSSPVLNLSLPCLPDPDQTPGRAKRGKSRQYSTGFEAAWKTYGRGEGKFAAFRAWEIEAEMVGGDQILLDLILAALKWQAPIFAADGWKFAPHFERYLKRKRWTDERPPSGRDATKGWAPPAPATAHVGGKVTW